MKSLVQFLLKPLKKKLLIWAEAEFRKAGLHIVRLHERAGACYIQDTKGTYHRIGGEK